MTRKASEAWRLVIQHVQVGTTDPQAFYDQKRTAMVVSRVLETVHDATIEVGSGYGATTRCLSMADGIRLAVGVDADRTLLQKSVSTKYPASFVEANAESGLPFKTDSVDCIVAPEIYEHLYRPHGFFVEARRVVRPGGRLILTTPNTESFVLMFLRRLPREWARRVLTREGDQKRYLHPEFFGDLMQDSVHGHRVEGASIREMERWARGYGFRQVDSLTWGLPFSHRFWRGLPRPLWLFFMGRFHALSVGLRHIMVVWEKQ